MEHEESAGEWKEKRLKKENWFIFARRGKCIEGVRVAFVGW